MLPVELAQTIGAAVIVATGKAFTTKDAGPESAVPQAFVKAARNCFPLSFRVALKLYVEAVAPAIFAKV